MTILWTYLHEQLALHTTCASTSQALSKQAVNSKQAEQGNVQVYSHRIPVGFINLPRLRYLWPSDSLILALAAAVKVGLDALVLIVPNLDSNQ